MQDKAFISVVVPVYNEEKYLEGCLSSMLAQDYPQSRMEWIFVDGGSTDRTRELLEGYRARFPGLICVLDNPHRTVPYAMNIGIRASRGEYIIRLDVHAEYAPDYFSSCISVLCLTGADNAGGVMVTKARTRAGRTIAKLVSSSFGVGNSGFRIGASDGFTDTVPFGAFRREIFRRVGLYDERLTRNQDSELNYRIIRAGGKIYLSHKIKLAYYCRDSVDGIIKMARLNGKWNIITMRLCPGSMRLRHFIPLMFVLSLIFLPLAGLLWSGFWRLLAAELAAYLTLDILFSLKSARDPVEALALLLLFPAFHLAYGLGGIEGLAVCAVPGGTFR